MKFGAILQAAAGLLVAGAAAAPTPETAEGPEQRDLLITVGLPSNGGSVVGRNLLGVETFNGIPYAEPPVGPLRLKSPQRFTGTLDKFDATGIAAACPQMFVSSTATDILGSVLNTLLDLPILAELTGQEDCLTINVQRPAGTKANAKLPVLFWIFGGGFELGGTNMYDATDLINFANKQAQPFIFVAVNYRVAGFGFMPGAEIKADGSANLGLQDQRMGLQWVADNIAAFGGDPDRVTIWGESAGSISVMDQMVLYGGDANYNGKPLFRGAIMNSGTIVPANPVDGEKGQAVYDQVVREAGCAGSPDTLACLREVDYETFLEAANSVPGILSYNSVALSYVPRPDGTVLPDSPDILINEGRYHAVPMITGDQEDEGTLFALFTPNITTTADLVQYLDQLYFWNASDEELKSLVNTVEGWTEGSPFRTGIFNELYPGFKRVASILGDLVFTLTRRVFLSAAHDVNPDVPSWSYLSSYNYGTPIMGTFHASDILQTFYGQFPNNAMRTSRTYYLNFLYNLDPNKGKTGYANWPRWSDKHDLMWFETGNRNSILADNFRDKTYQWIRSHVSALNI
jgi:carboxylesterase type B